MDRFDLTELTRSEPVKQKLEFSPEREDIDEYICRLAEHNDIEPDSEQRKILELFKYFAFSFDLKCLLDEKIIDAQEERREVESSLIPLSLQTFYELSSRKYYLNLRSYSLKIYDQPEVSNNPYAEEIVHVEANLNAYGISEFLSPLEAFLKGYSVDNMPLRNEKAHAVREIFLWFQPNLEFTDPPSVLNRIEEYFQGRPELFSRQELKAFAERINEIYTNENEEGNSFKNMRFFFDKMLLRLCLDIVCRI